MEKVAVPDSAFDMRIAIVNFTSGGLSGGYRKYLSRVVPLLQCDSRIKRLDIFTPVDIGLASKGKVQWHLMPRDYDIKVVAWLKRHLAKLKPDVVFIPTARWINFNGIPTVIMVRNMAPLLVPFKGNSIKECFKNIARYVSALKACRRANRIIAISNHVREFLVKKWRVDPSRIGLVYHGVDIQNNLSLSTPPKNLSGYKISRFIFTAGSIRPARGLEGSIKAMKFLKDLYSDLSLIIAGNTDSGTESYRRRLNVIAKKFGVSERIFWVGQLSENEMNWCYKNCSAFIMTSRAEACPNIALEAMSHSCMIVSTTQPPMPEFFRNAAFYYNAGNSSNLAQQIHAALELSEEERMDKRAATRTIAEEFSWERTARLTIDQLALSHSK